MTGGNDKKVPGGRDGRFPKGQSGNSAGRPKARPKAHPNPIAVLFDRPVRVARNGTTEEVPAAIALQLCILKAAFEGKASARREVLRWIARRNKARMAALRARTVPGIKVTFSESPTNAQAALLLLGIASINPFWGDDAGPYERVILEPWAVQHALGRRHGGARLHPTEIFWIKQCTRDANSLRWPRGTDE